MDPLIWHKVAAISGMAALGLGTYGAHGFKPSNPSYKEVWNTASLYHLVHTAALVGAPMAKNPNIFGGLLATGIIAFSGMSLHLTSNFLAWMNNIRNTQSRFWQMNRCYAVAFLEDRTYAKVAPLGGFAFIAAWGSLLF